ncbi:RidA family protein [Nocardioides panacis]|uniref:RidA family protein n=1 Tax=Nocardioides panacis TaxID=2849501 RepID=A0A975T054_9ACTN|nr:RidA family protein [Nocardioides panacis]QWZ08610.1 RidA family protein [Nocardioides panacis]
MTHTSHVVDQLPAPGGAYSHVTQTSQLTFTAGFGPHDPETGAFPEGIEAQTEATLANVERALGAVGLDLSHILKSTVHLAHLERDFAGFDAVYRRLVPQPYPVRTTVGSQLLGILVEIDVVAEGAR